ncbi:unnamed protein product, partial [Ostreobium quekettii]|eukprot:evm.model.scf_806.1 EVM.evm.TU.scf_806.1   scf_806:327-2804(-)
MHHKAAFLAILVLPVVAVVAEAPVLTESAKRKTQVSNSKDLAVSEVSSNHLMPTPSDDPNATGWKPVPKGRFPALVTFHCNVTPNCCQGVVIKKYYAVTAAHCLDAIGKNPLAYIGGHEAGNDLRAAAKVQIIRVEETFVHPNWTGHVADGHDIAILKLSQPYTGLMPTLADKPLLPVGNKELLAFRWGNHSLEMARMSTANTGCRGLTGMGENILCAYSEDAVIKGGCSGSALFVLDDPPETNGSFLDAIAGGRTDIDIVFGITSYVNGTMMFNNEKFGFAYTPISLNVEWIRGYTDPQ